MIIKRTKEQADKFGALALHEIITEAELNGLFYMPGISTFDGKKSYYLTLVNEALSIHADGLFDGLVEEANNASYIFYLKIPEEDAVLELTFVHGELKVPEAQKIFEPALLDIADSLSAQLYNEYGKAMHKVASEKSFWSRFQL
jgi:hypothetical protein